MKRYVCSCFPTGKHVNEKLLHKQPGTPGQSLTHLSFGFLQLVIKSAARGTLRFTGLRHKPVAFLCSLARTRLILFCRY